MFVETPLVDRIFGQIRLDDLKLAVMSATFAILAQTILIVVVAEIGLMEFAGSLGEDVVLLHAILVVVFEIVGATHSLIH